MDEHGSSQYEDVLAALSRESGTLFLAKDEVIRIHDLLVNRFGGTFGIRDHALLESAVSRPLQQVAYHPESADPAHLGALLCEGLIKNHAFVDGNKRTGLASALRFFDANHLQLSMDPVTLYKAIVMLAAGHMDASQLAAVWKPRLRPATPSQVMTNSPQP